MRTMERGWCVALEKEGLTCSHMIHDGRIKNFFNFNGVLGVGFGGGDVATGCDLRPQESGPWMDAMKLIFSKRRRPRSTIHELAA